jgi:hypothetical protein
MKMRREELGTPLQHRDTKKDGKGFLAVLSKTS